MSDSPTDTLAAVVAACEATSTKYAVIGAVARNAWAPPRATTDLDLAVSVTTEGYDALLEGLAECGFEPRQSVRAESLDSLPDVVLLRRPIGTVRRLDLLLAKSAFELEAIERAAMVDIGVTCRVVQPEHLIVYKLIAGRPRDLGDAEDVARTQSLAGRSLDLTTIRKWAHEWSIEDRLETLLAQLAR